MAVGFIPTFGEGPGEYCPGDCEHTDCAAARKLVAEPCVTCGRPIGDELRFYRAEGGGHEHMHCLHNRINTEKAER